MIQAKTVDGLVVHLTEEEVKRLADHYWEHSGKHKMKDFFIRYQHTAADNIRKALGYQTHPDAEEKVKAAIAEALEAGNPDVIAEVVYEAMEWQTAYANLKSID